MQRKETKYLTSLSSSTRLEQSVREETLYYKKITVALFQSLKSHLHLMTTLPALLSRESTPSSNSLPFIAAVQAWGQWGASLQVFCVLSAKENVRVCWSEKVSSLRKEVAAFDRYQCPCDLIGKVKAKRRDGISRSLPRLGKPLLELNLMPAVWDSFLFRRYKYLIVTNWLFLVISNTDSVVMIKWGWRKSILLLTMRRWDTVQRWR